MCLVADPKDGLGDIYDPEHGITPEMEKMLRERKSAHQVLDWDTLWGILFRHDVFVPDGGRSITTCSLFTPSHLSVS